VKKSLKTSFIQNSGMIDKDLNNYMKAMKSTKDSEKKVSFQLVFSDRKQAFEKQKGKCAKCNQTLKPVYCKYIKDPNTKQMVALCSSCAVPTSGRRN